MGRKDTEEELIRLGYIITRLRQKHDESLQRFRSLRSATSPDMKDPDEELEEILEECGAQTPSSLVQQKTESKSRKSRHPEGPPLNRQVLQFLRRADTPSTYQDVLKEVDAHHQSIQNSLRDLARRGYAVKLDRNLWVAADGGGKRGGLSVVD